MIPRAPAIVGDATNRVFLERAEILHAPSVLITTHDDDTNVFLTILCRRLHPDRQFTSGVIREGNVSIIDRVGADWVRSCSSMGANAIANHLGHTNVLMLT